MTATKGSYSGRLLAVLLVVSGFLNLYQWRRDSTAEQRLPDVSVTHVAQAKTASAVGLTSLDFAKDADLPTLRDALYAAGATDTRTRQIIYGLLQRRLREAQTKKRLATIGRGWWKDEARTLGISRSTPSIRDEQVMMKEMVDDQMEAMFGVDPAQAEVVNARYSMLPEELQMKLARIERKMLLPSQWQPTGDPEADARTEAEWAKMTKENRAEKEKLLASLTPEQRREYDMRYGTLGTRLASEYRNVPGGTEEEFRKIYRIAEESAGASNFGVGSVTVGSGTLILTGGAGTSSPQAAAEANQRIADRVVAELGYDRALDYLWAGANEYRAVATMAQQANLPAATAGRFTQLVAETGAKANAIHNDASLNIDQRQAALIALQQAARAEVDGLVPAEVQQKLPPVAMAWLTQMSTGQYRMIAPGVPGRSTASTMVSRVAGNAPTLPPSMLPPPSRPAGK